MGRCRYQFFLCLVIIVILGTVIPATRAASEEEGDAEIAKAHDRKNNDEKKASIKKKTIIDSLNATDAVIQRNPDYNSDDDSDVEDDEPTIDDEYEDEDSPEEEDDDVDVDVKTMLDRALGQSRKVPRKTLLLIKKHRIKITFVLALIAFRREIGRMIINKIAPPVGVDKETGKVLRKRVRLSPTSILKIVVFIDIIRQVQKAGKKKDPLMIAFLLFGARNPVLSSLITKAILQENNSYVPPVEQHYTFERINDRYEKDCLALKKAASHRTNSDMLPSLSQLHQRRTEKTHKVYSETVIVLDLSRIDSSRIDTLRDETSFLIHQHRQQTIPYANSMDRKGQSNITQVEVLVLLESPGGSASDFALASEQLLRLRKEPGVQVTVCVDKVAASGGYMIACASSPGRLYAAPFAVLGSIGVIGQAVNVQKVLEGWGVKPLVFRAGKEKAPVGLIGDISSKDMKTIQSMVDETHAAFKRHVVYSRPRLEDSIEQLATGKIWLGYDALRVGLIDRLVTSDEYIGERMQSGAKLLKLIRNPRRRTFFGGPTARRGIESRIQSSIISPLKEKTKKALLGLVEKSDLPLESLYNLEPLSTKIAGFADTSPVKSSQSPT